MSARIWTVWSGEMHDEFTTHREAVTYAKELDRQDRANGTTDVTIEVEDHAGATAWTNLP